MIIVSGIEKSMDNRLNLFLTALSRKSPDTQRTYKSILNYYLNFTSKPLEYTNVINFLNHLEGAGYSQSSLSVTFSVLKFFFKVYNTPFDNTNSPKIDIYKQNHPVLTTETIQQMISIIKENGTPQQKAFLSVSTTFGLRNSELCGISQKDNIKQENNNYYLFVNTKKGGFPRWHLIPQNIQTYIKDYLFIFISKLQGNLIFKYICSLIDLTGKEREGFGWHAIRRALIRELYMQGFSEYELNIFFRYGSAKTSIINRYSRMERDDPKLFEIDMKIFEKHPFLKWWN